MKLVDKLNFFVDDWKYKFSIVCMFLPWLNLWVRSNSDLNGFEQFYINELRSPKNSFIITHVENICKIDRNNNTSIVSDHGNGKNTDNLWDVFLIPPAICQRC